VILGRSGNPQILSIPQGVKMLLTACENETHIDLIVNALKASFFFFLEGQAAKLITELSGQTIEAGDFYFDPHILTR